MALDVIIRCARANEPVNALITQERTVARVDRAAGELLKGHEVLAESGAHDGV
jgi:hypothetical protein